MPKSKCRRRRLAAFNHFGVARDDGNPGFTGGFGHRAHDALKVGERKAFLENEACAQVKGLRTAHRHVVDGAADGEASDVAPGEEEGLDDMRVAGNRNGAHYRRHHGAVVALVEPVVAKVFGKKLLDEFGRGAPARAVDHFDGTAADVDFACIAGFDGHFLPP